METLFGKSYETVGNVNSDLLLKTRGSVMVLIGNRFIDLLKGDEQSSDSASVVAKNILTLDSDPAQNNTLPERDGLYMYDNLLYIMNNGTLYSIGLTKV